MLLFIEIKSSKIMPHLDPYLKKQDYLLLLVEVVNS